MNVKAVVFDLDGTLLDTLADLKNATNHALGTVGRRALGTDEVRRFVGNGVPKLIERALAHTQSDGAPSDDAAVGECLASFTEYYDAHNADNTAPYDGITEMLAELKTRGIKTAIVTNKYDGAAQALKSEFFNSVDIAVGTSDRIRPKPATDGVELALKALGADRSCAVYVGDGETDMQTAAACGLAAVAVGWGFRDRALLETFAPYAVIDSPRELVCVLDALERE